MRVIRLSIDMIEVTRKIYLLSVSQRLKAFSHSGHKKRIIHQFLLIELAGESISTLLNWIGPESLCGIKQ